MGLVGPILIELLVGIALVELSVRFLPRRVHKVTTENCFRLDGTISDHRASRENQAKWSLRALLGLAFLLICLIGNVAAYVLNYSLIPMDVVARTLVAVRTDQQQFADNLRDSLADRDYATFLKKGVEPSTTEVDQALTTLQDKWPTMALSVAGAIFAALVIFLVARHFAYRKFLAAAEKRGKDSYRRDMSRMSTDGSKFAIELLASQATDDNSRDSQKDSV